MQAQRIEGPQPTSGAVAFFYIDVGEVIRDHFVCFETTTGKTTGRYAVAVMASEDTDFYDYLGPSPESRGLEAYSIQRLCDSPRLNGYDQNHIVICLGEKSFDIVCQQFWIEPTIEGDNPGAVLVQYLMHRGGVFRAPVVIPPHPPMRSELRSLLEMCLRPIRFLFRKIVR